MKFVSLYNVHKFFEVDVQILVRYGYFRKVTVNELVTRFHQRRAAQSVCKLADANYNVRMEAGINNANIVIKA